MGKLLKVFGLRLQEQEITKQQAIWNVFGEKNYYEKRVKKEKRRWEKLKKKLEKANMAPAETDFQDEKNE